MTAASPVSRQNGARMSSRPGPGPAALAMWFALLAGLVEVSIWSVRRSVLDRMTFLSPEMVWMAPLANVILFGLLAGVLALATRCSRWISARTICFILALLASVGSLSSFTWLAWYTRVLLSLGLAVQIARLASLHASGFRMVVHRTLPLMLLLVAAFVGARHVPRIFATRIAVSRAQAAAPNAPNVLLIVLDTVRADALSLYGYTRPTSPALERLAATSTRFEWALTTAPWTLPAHGSLFTGRLPHELSTDWRRPLDGSDGTLAELLSAHGYRTAGFVANTIYCNKESGLNRGFAHYEDYLVSPGEILLSASLSRTVVNSHHLRRIINYYQVLGHKNAERINRDFLVWLATPDARPFFAFLNYFDAHEPYLPPDDFTAPFTAVTERDLSGMRYWLHEAAGTGKRKRSERDIQAERAAYDRAIAYIDHHLGALLADLQRRDVLDNTLLIVTSDHGEQFGEHRLFTHGNSLYLTALRVPLLIRFPGAVPAGLTVREPASLRDIPRTVADLTGLTDAQRFPGTSLARYWDTSQAAPAPQPVLAELEGQSSRTPWRGAVQSVMFDGRHYIRSADGREELYDFATDPSEEHDLADTAGVRGLRTFRELVAAAIPGAAS